MEVAVNVSDAQLKSHSFSPVKFHAGLGTGDQLILRVRVIKGQDAGVLSPTVVTAHLPCIIGVTVNTLYT